jgi:hypothetical protein
MTIAAAADIALGGAVTTTNALSNSLFDLTG